MSDPENIIAIACRLGGCWPSGIGSVAIGSENAAPVTLTSSIKIIIIYIKL